MQNAWSSYQVTQLIARFSLPPGASVHVTTGGAQFKAARNAGVSATRLVFHAGPHPPWFAIPPSVLPPAPATGPPACVPPPASTNRLNLPTVTSYRSSRKLL